jgi:hypothetical protein
MMADATHTQGPWVYVGEYVEAHDIDTPLSICTIADCGGQTGANATLIAAAPDLLAALEVLVWQLDRTDGLVEELESMVVEAKAAIAQTKGEA